MTRKALIVVTSTEKYPNMERATGLWLGEAVHFYHVLEQAGWHIDFVSPRGGLTPIDPVSLQTGVQKVDWEYYANPTFRHKLANTHKPEEIIASQYSCIYYAGGHGVVFDFLENAKLQEISREIYEKNHGVVSSVCHGAVGLINIKLSDGEYLVKGKKLTGFSNNEEKLAGLDEHVPFLTETELIKHGAIYEKAEQPFTEFGVADKQLITGQNPQSGAVVGKLVLKHFEEQKH